MSVLPELSTRFLRERTYVQNISPTILAWYTQAWRAFVVQFAHFFEEWG